MRRDLPFRWSRAPGDEVLEVPSQEDEHKAFSWTHSFPRSFQDSLEDYSWDAVEYAECEVIVKDYPPFVEAMKKRGIDDMDLVMVDPWCVGYHREADAPSRRLAKPLIFCRIESDCRVHAVRRIFEYLDKNSLNFPVIHHIEFPKQVHRDDLVIGAGTNAGALTWDVEQPF